MHKERYQKIWDRVKKNGEGAKTVPGLVAHLGPISGKSAVIWVRINDDSYQISNDAATWSLHCGERDVKVASTIIDKDYSTARLEVPVDAISKEGELCTVGIRDNGKVKHSADVCFPPAATFSESEEFFSFAAFSCNEPFHARHNGILARDLSLWQRLQMRTKGEKSSGGVLPDRPSFVLGLGDQVYVDPDPDVRDGLALFYGESSDKSNYQACCKKNYRTLLDNVYRYNFSMPTLAGTLNGIPSYMMWDDHEIRDGWGSHGDEETGMWPLYFREARHAFISNQYMRMLPAEKASQSEYDKLINSEEALHYLKDNIKKDVHLLMLDGRSRRSKSGLYDEDAKKIVEKWLKSGKDNVSDLFILTVGVPLFPSRHGEDGGLQQASSMKPDMRDDLDDSWGSEKNRCVREELLADLEAHFEKHPKDRLLVMSGDVHQSAMFFIELNGKIIGHEVVTSGISNIVNKREVKGKTLVDVSRDTE